jgi:AAA+ ATPase superfamily predicted ATPase
MKANPGGTVTGDGIIGRSSELAELWNKLQKRSVLLSAERRVGKTSLLRKMTEEPPSGWTPLLIFVESARHPIDCVEAMYDVVSEAKMCSTKGVWMHEIGKAFEKLGSAQVGGWKLPQVQSDWRQLMRTLVQDIVEHSDTGAILMIDEFPLMIWNIADDHGAPLAMQFLDALREVRQEFESTNRIRFVLSGSIGFHLVLQHLKLDHGYKGAPTNDMYLFVLTGMDTEDTELMCRQYLDHEGIRRQTPETVAARMYYRTDGLPLYIQYVCEALQDSKASQVVPEDIDRILDGMLADRQVTWFRDAAQRIEGYYAKFGFDRTASVILNRLSREENYFAETAIVDTVQAGDSQATPSGVQRVVELLTDDNYLLRDTSSGERKYRFRYRLMRQWWKINRA